MLKSNFLNFRFFYHISVPDILNDMGIDYNNMSDQDSFLVNDSILSSIELVLKRKKYSAIVYSNPWLDYECIKNIHSELKPTGRINNIALLDFKSIPKNIELWQFFEEVIFFPEIRKKEIIECESVQTPMFYWLNNKKLPKDLEDKYPDLSSKFNFDKD